MSVHEQLLYLWGSMLYRVFLTWGHLVAVRDALAPWTWPYTSRQTTREVKDNGQLTVRPRP